MYSQDIHTVISIPPKFSVSDLMGFLKVKMSLNLFSRYEKLGKRYWKRHLWLRGYCVSTIGLDEDKIKKYVKWQEKKDRENDQVQLKKLL
ncbi:MAG: IS200/IS605 family transposase [Candidatus Omnitrophica bacterium]|nr:IS200/IS605 family transposase [Candidatus Omnitrophota bacterium]